MALPKKLVKKIDLIPQKTGVARREEMLEYIKEHGTYLPKSLLHAELDRGMLDFVKEDLKTVVDGKVIPAIDIIITLQNWSLFTETWKFQDLDKNASPPFITTVRQPEVKPGTNPSVKYNIPDRKEFFYARVPTWDGTRKGLDIYKIPQPVPVDITYNVKIMCKRMRELNQFNKIVLQKFASRQAYRVINGHYVPIILNNISDESAMEMDKQKYYLQNYEFVMLGFLVDEEEFEVTPGITRSFLMLESQNRTRSRRVRKLPASPKNFPLAYGVGSTDTEVTVSIPYTVNFTVDTNVNVDSYSVYINGDYIGDDVAVIQLTLNDILKIEFTKINAGQVSSISGSATLQ
jgi:hypothetical protein